MDGYKRFLGSSFLAGGVAAVCQSSGAVALACTSMCLLVRCTHERLHAFKHSTRAASWLLLWPAPAPPRLYACHQLRAAARQHCCWRWQRQRQLR
jgi:hypothetical protein